MKLTCCFVLAVCAVLLTSCAFNEAHGVPASKVIDGTELTLSSKLNVTAKGKHQYDLSGTLAVHAVGGTQPATVRIDYFSVRAAKPDFFAIPFVRDASGNWHSHAMTTTPDEASSKVVERQEPGATFLDFNLPELGGGLLDNPANYDRVDVVVGVLDSKGKRHLLANEVVPTEH